MGLTIPNTMTLSDTVWEDLRIPGSQARVGASAPNFAKFIDNGAGSSGVYSYQFSPTLTNEVHFDIQLPHAYKLGTDLHLHVHWAPMTSGAGNVVWLAEYSLAKIGAVFPNMTIQQITAATDSTAYKHHVDEFAAISGTGIDSVSTILRVRLARIGGDGADTYAGAAALLSVDVHYQLDTVGSNSETVK